MNDRFEIFWSELAEDSYIQILNYLLDNQYSNAAIKLDQSTEKLMSRLQNFSELCPPSSKIPQLRKCAVNEYISMIYRVSDNLIEIVAFIDNRSNHSF